MTNSLVSVDSTMAQESGLDLDPRSWALWLLAGAILTMSTRNPFYLVLLLSISRSVDAICGRRYSGSWSLPFWRLSATILIFSVVFNMLMAHVGSTVLATLPESWWLIGGPVTLEAAIFGLVSGLSLITLLSFFLAFTHVVPPHRMIQLVPRALHELGLVALIAMTFIPQTIVQQKRIREAQAIRGYQARGLRSWRPLVIPLLVGGMERSLNLAETMVSRGFGSVESRQQSTSARLLLVLSVSLALGGAIWLAWGGIAGWIVVAAGLGVLLVAYWLMGRGVRHTRYRAQSWQWQDTVVVVAAVLPVLLLMLPLDVIDRSTLSYAPYSVSIVPQFDAIVGLILFTLAAPSILELV